MRAALIYGVGMIAALYLFYLFLPEPRRRRRSQPAPVIQRCSGEFSHHFFSRVKLVPPR